VILPLGVEFPTPRHRASRCERSSPMGDKGGKKDKAKSQKQDASKQKQKAKVKQDKQPKRKP